MARFSVAALKSFFSSVKSEIIRQFESKYPEANKGKVAFAVFLLLGSLTIAAPKLLEGAVSLLFADNAGSAGTTTAEKPSKDGASQPAGSKAAKEPGASIRSESTGSIDPDRPVTLPPVRQYPLTVSTIELANAPDELVSPANIGGGIRPSGQMLFSDFMSRISYQSCVHPTESFSLEAVAAGYLSHTWTHDRARLSRLIDMAAGFGNKPYEELEWEEPFSDYLLANYLLMAVDAHELGRDKEMYARLKKVAFRMKLNSEGYYDKPQAEAPTFDIVLFNPTDRPELITNMDFDILAAEFVPIEGAGDGDNPAQAFHLPVVQSLVMKADTTRTIATLQAPIVVPPGKFARWKVTLQVPDLDDYGVAAWLGYLSFRAGDKIIAQTRPICSIVPPTERNPAQYGS